MANFNETHITTTPNSRAPLPIEEFKKELLGDYQKQVTNFFMGDKERAMKFMSAIVYSVQKTPELLNCDRNSLMTAFMTCAEYRLYPSSASGEAYVIPYKGKAQFQLGYQGGVTLAYRAGTENINSEIVYENDEFVHTKGLHPDLKHVPAPFGKEKGKPVGVYAVAEVNGKPIFCVMSEEEVMKFRNLSQAKGSEYSPWNSDKDPQLWMWRKTCLKQLLKLLPKNEEISKALEKDNEDSVVSKQRSSLDAGGPAVGAALHGPQRIMIGVDTASDPPTTVVTETSGDITYVKTDDSEAELNRALRKESEEKK